MKIPSTLCFSALALAGCSQREAINVGAPPPPPDYLVCEELPPKPDLKPLEAFTLPDGRTAYLKADVDARDGHIARYVVAVRGAWFSCSNQLGKVRDYYGSAEER
jgi:hypothetical protein